jgi:VWFA-related protein
VEHRIRRPGKLAASLWLVVAAALLTPPLHAQSDTAEVRPGAAGEEAGPEITSLTLSQLQLRLPVLRAYLQARDADGRFVAELAGARLSATVAGEPIPITGTQPFEAEGEGVAYILVMDVSRTVEHHERQFRVLRDALRPWLASLGPRDQVAIVRFGDAVEVVEEFTRDTLALARALEALEPVEPRTLFYDGMKRGLELAARQDAALPERRVIVVISDGQDTVAGGVSEQEVLDRIQEVHVPVFGIGLYDAERQRRPTPEQVQGLQVLGRFARSSGGEFVRADSGTPAELFAALTRYAHEVHLAELTCEGCPQDGNVHRLQLTLETGERALGDGAYVRLVPGPAVPQETVPVAAPWWRGWWGIGVLLAVLLGIVAVGFGLRRRRRTEELPDEIAGAPVAAEAPSAAEGIEAKPAGSGEREPKPPPPLYIRLTPLGITSEDNGRSVELMDELRIGRSPTASDVAFPDDPEISSIHCVLLRRDPFLVLRDLESTNGTLVNGIPIHGEHRVEDNDVIGIGRSELRLSIYEADDEDRA